MLAGSSQALMASGSEETLPEVEDVTTNTLPAAPELDISATIPQPQETLPKVGDIAANMLPGDPNLEVIVTQPEDNEENVLAISVTSKGKKRQRASSGTARSQSHISIPPSHYFMKLLPKQF